MQERDQFAGYRDPDTFDVRGALRGLTEAARRYKWLVAASCAVSLSLTTAYVLLFPPTFVVKSQVMVEKAVDNSRDSFYSTWAVFRKDDPRTEIELMTAPALIAEVVKKEGLKYDDVYHPTTAHLARMWRNSLPGRTYRGIKESLFPKTPDQDAPTQEDIQLGETVTGMQSGIKVTPVADSSIGEITVKGPTRRVARITNTLVNTYLERRSERFRAEAQRNLDALDQEVSAAAKEASEISGQRLAFLRSHSLSFDLGKESQQLTKLVELEDGVAANRAKVASLKASLRLVESQMSAEPATRTASTTVEQNTVRESAKLKRLDLETGLISLRSVYREDSPEVREVRENIAELDRLISREPEKVEKLATVALNSTRQDLVLSRNSLQSQLQGIEAGLAVMEDTQKDLRARIGKVPELQNQLRDMDRQFALVNDRYQALSAKRAQAAVSKAMAMAAMPSMQVVQVATPPDEPQWPKLKLLFPTALLVGLLLGVVAARIRMLTSGRVSRTGLDAGGLDSPIYASIRIPLCGPPFDVAGSGRKVRMGKDGRWNHDD